MSDLANIYDAEVQINFSRWGKWNLENLTNDGVVLFQYLVFKCRSNAEWTHSDKEIERELGIKRTRLERVRSKLESAGILKTRVTLNKDRNKITAYRIDFKKLSSDMAVLTQIYNSTEPGSERDPIPADLKRYAAIYKQLAAEQPPLDRVPASKAAGVKEKKKTNEIFAFGNRLIDLYLSRQQVFNEERKGQRHSLGTISFSPTEIRRLGSAMQHFENDQYIYNAFLAFADQLFIEKIIGNSPTNVPSDLRKPVSYFLSYDEGEATFSVIRKYGDYHAARYGRG